MEHIQIVKAAYSAIEAGDFDTVEGLLHENYQLTGPVSQSMGKEDVLKLLKALKAALPDFAFSLSDLKETDEQVSGIQHVTGTHSHTLDLSFMGVPTQTATGKKVKLPDEPFKVEFMGNQISKLHFEPVEGGGVPGLLTQIGATVEAPA